MIIWLASYPRSGNTYFRFLVKHLCGVYPPSIYQSQEIRRQDKQNTQEGRLHELIDIETLSADSEKYLIKTHELPQDERSAIYLVRDGRDALVSYAWFQLQVEYSENDFFSILRRLINTNEYFGGWGPHVLAWTQRKATTTIVKFEELVLSPDPLSIVKQSLENVEYHVPDKLMTNNSLPTFRQLQKKEPKIFRKGQIGSWRSEMTPDLHNVFWKQFGCAMQKMGYNSNNQPL